MAKRTPKRRPLRKHKKKRRIPVLVCLAILIGAAVFMILKTRTLSISERDYPPSLVRLAETQPEALSFVKAYPDREVPENVDLSDEIKEGQLPLFLQWDKRWGFTKYGDDFMAITGCGPTCLSMVYVYLTGDTAMHPGKMAKWAEKEGFYVQGAGTSWALMDLGAETLGLHVYTTALDAAQMTAALKNGEVIICSVGSGDFTTEGHFIVLASIDEDGKVIVHDPNSRKRSEKTWDLDQIIPQIKQFWIYE